jgi:hypothetical protein
MSLRIRVNHIVQIWTHPVTTILFSILLQSRWKDYPTRCCVLLWAHLNTLPNSLLETIRLSRKHFIYLAFDVLPESVVCYCSIVRAAAQVMSAKREMFVSRNFILRTGMETLAVSAGAPNVIVLDDGQYGNAAQRGSWFSYFRYGQMFPAHLPRPLACSCSTSLLPLLLRQK